MIVVSACLAKIRCNYKGECKDNSFIIGLIKDGKAIPLCPEQLGGLSTPRSGARIETGNGEDVLDGKSKVLTDDGQDVTLQFLNGARETLSLLQRIGVTTVILKQGSPSCGHGKTQGGVTERSCVPGNGITTALLKRNNIKIYTEDDIHEGIRH